MLSKTVFCSFDFEAWHNWPGAPAEYTYLSNSHRHMFHVVVTASVTDNERELEIIDMKHKFHYFSTTKFLGTSDKPMPYSCETMCESLIDYAKMMYGAERSYTVEVSEDGENGALITYTPDDVTGI